MEVNRLLNDEITYELLIRGLPISGTVAIKRSVLREALRSEKMGTNCPPVSVDLDLDSELTKCNDKLGDLEEDIKNFNHGNAENEFKRISSRLSHILMRLDRLQCEGSIEEKRNLLCGWCKQLYDTLRKIIEQPIMDEPPPQQLSQSLMDEPILLIPELVGQSSENVSDECRERADVVYPGTSQDSTRRYERSHAEQKQNELHKSGAVRFEEPCRLSLKSNEQPFHSTGRENYQPMNFGKQLGTNSAASTKIVNDDYSNRVNSTMDLSTQLRNLQFTPHHYSAASSHGVSLTNGCDVHRWGIKYDGQSSLPTFLERLEEIRQSRGVTKDRLLQSAVELFEKDALLWYRMNNFTSWEDLVGKLRDAFQPYDYENALWDEIRRRTQGTHERVISYVSVMESMFRRLPTKPSEDERVRIIRRNMLPYIQTQMSLQSTNSLQDLIRIARMVEDTEWRVQKFSPPPTNCRNLVEPDLAYRGSRQSHVSVARVETEVERRSTDLLKQSLCWNCGDNGHKFKKCHKPKKIFCYKCGKHNVTSLKCPECTKNSKARQ